MAGHHGHHMHSMGMDHTTAAMETDNSTCSQACISAMQQMMHHMTHGSANHAMGGGEHGGGHNLAGHYVSKNLSENIRDDPRYGLSQGEEALLYNASSHWQSPYPEWSLSNMKFRYITV